ARARARQEGPVRLDDRSRFRFGRDPPQELGATALGVVLPAWRLREPDRRGGRRASADPRRRLARGEVAARVTHACSAPGSCQARIRSMAKVAAASHAAMWSTMALGGGPSPATLAVPTTAMRGGRALRSDQTSTGACALKAKDTTSSP